MMPNPRLAGRYAKSLIDLSIANNKLEEVYQDMLFLQKVCTSSKEFVSVVRSPVIKADKKEKILDAITGGKIGTLTSSFNKLLVRKGREPNLPEIVNAFIKQYKDFQNIYILKLTTASPVSEELKNAIEGKIRTDSNMQNLELFTLVDEKIIGGFVLEVGDNLVDASISHALNEIKMQFQNNDFIYKVR